MPDFIITGLVSPSYTQDFREIVKRGGPFVERFNLNTQQPVTDDEMITPNIITRGGLRELINGQHFRQSSQWVLELELSNDAAFDMALNIVETLARHNKGLFFPYWIASKYSSENYCARTISFFLFNMKAPRADIAYDILGHDYIKSWMLQVARLLEANKIPVVTPKYPRLKAEFSVKEDSPFSIRACRDSNNNHIRYDLALEHTLNEKQTPFNPYCFEDKSVKFLVDKSELEQHEKESRLITMKSREKRINAWIDEVNDLLVDVSPVQKPTITILYCQSNPSSLLQEPASKPENELVTLRKKPSSAFHL